MINSNLDPIRSRLVSPEVVQAVKAAQTGGMEQDTDFVMMREKRGSELVRLEDKALNHVVSWDCSKKSVMVGQKEYFYDYQRIPSGRVVCFIFSP